MNLSDIIKNDLTTIFAYHPTKTITYANHTYQAICSDLVSLSVLQMEGIYDQADISLIVNANDFSTKPKEGEFLSLDSVTYKIVKVTKSNDTKLTLDIAKIKGK